MAGWRLFATAPAEERAEIIVYRPDAGVFAAAFRDDCWFSVCGEDLTGDLPTHWMPFPAAPQPDPADPAEAERKPAGAHQYFAGLLCPRCAAGDRPEWRIVFQTWCHVWTTANGHSHCPAELIWKDLELHGDDPQPIALEELLAAAREVISEVLHESAQYSPFLTAAAQRLLSASAKCREVQK